MNGDAIQRLRRCIDEARWTFAKSYAHWAPHEWHNTPEDGEFWNLLVEQLRQYGVVEPGTTQFGKVVGRWHYLYLDGYKYWPYWPVHKGCTIETYLRPEWPQANRDGTRTVNRFPVDGFPREKLAPYLEAYRQKQQEKAEARRRRRGPELPFS